MILCVSVCYILCTEFYTVINKYINKDYKIKSRQLMKIVQWTMH